MIIAGNKVDLSHKQKISENNIANLAKKYGAQYQMTSAKENFGIEEVFEKIVDEFIENQKCMFQKPGYEKQSQQGELLDVGVGKNKSGNCSC